MAGEPAGTTASPTFGSSAAAKTYAAAVDGNEYLVGVERADNDWRVRVNDGEVMAADFVTKGAFAQYSLLLDHRSYEGIAEVNGEGLKVWVEGEPFLVSVMDQRLKALAGGRALGARSQQAAFKTPMPGMVVDVMVESGAEVIKGQPLLTLEAMKMRNDLKSPRDGQVKSVLVQAGQTVAKGDTLVEFED